MNFDFGRKHSLPIRTKMPGLTSSHENGIKSADQMDEERKEHVVCK